MLDVRVTECGRFVIWLVSPFTYRQLTRTCSDFIGLSDAPCPEERSLEESLFSSSDGEEEEPSGSEGEENRERKRDKRPYKPEELFHDDHPQYNLLLRISPSQYGCGGQAKLLNFETEHTVYPQDSFLASLSFPEYRDMKTRWTRSWDVKGDVACVLNAGKLGLAFPRHPNVRVEPINCTGDGVRITSGGVIVAEGRKMHYLQWFDTSSFFSSATTEPLVVFPTRFHSPRYLHPFSFALFKPEKLSGNMMKDLSAEE